MTPKIVTIIVLSVITFFVVGFMAFAYSLIIRDTRKLSSNGLLDDEFIREDQAKEKKWISVALSSVSVFFSVVLVAFCSIGLVYRIERNQLVIHGQTAMVIASNSMEDYYSEEYKGELVDDVVATQNISNEEATYFLDKTHFNVGDMLTFTKIDIDNPLSLYEVYGYKNSKGDIIVHRLVGIEDNKYVFRGDNTVANDSYVKREQILYRYNNTKLVFVGNLVLFFSSGFGIYTMLMVVLVFVMSDIAKHQYNAIKRNRLAKLGRKVR